MSTNISIIGTVATDPRLTETDSGLSVCSFRLASNERRYDRSRGEWVDGDTNWFTVSAFRSLAAHARDSFAKGDRVIVSGRLRIRDWKTEEKSGTSVEVDADALGHDVRWGVSTFRKHRSSSQQDEVRDAADRDESAETHTPWNTPDEATESLQPPFTPAVDHSASGSSRTVGV